MKKTIIAICLVILATFSVTNVYAQTTTTDNLHTDILYEYDEYKNFVEENQDENYLTHLCNTFIHMYEQALNAGNYFETANSKYTIMIDDVECYQKLDGRFIYDGKILIENVTELVGYNVLKKYTDSLISLPIESNNNIKSNILYEYDEYRKFVEENQDENYLTHLCNTFVHMYEQALNAGNYFETANSKYTIMIDDVECYQKLDGRFIYDGKILIENVTELVGYNVLREYVANDYLNNVQSGNFVYILGNWRYVVTSKNGNVYYVTEDGKLVCNDEIIYNNIATLDNATINGSIIYHKYGTAIFIDSNHITVYNFGRLVGIINISNFDR